jgi:histone H3/H4
MLTAKTQVKDILKEEGMRNMSNDFMERLDQEVEKLIRNSVKRAKENLRKTVMGRDL